MYSFFKQKITTSQTCRDMERDGEGKEGEDGEDPCGGSTLVSM
jgi:hypothetical protein